MYFWEAAKLARKSEAKIAEAVFDAVADAYLIESDSEFFIQVKYLEKLKRRLKEVEFDELAHQIDIALTTLDANARLREDRAVLNLKAQEESELRELLEILPWIDD